MRWIWLVGAAGCMEYSPIAPVEVGTGSGSTGEIWDLESGEVDVLFFGDTSQSMERELGTLGDHVRRYVDRLAEHAPDWQLGVVTGPTGCAVGGVLSPETPDHAERFAEAMLTRPTDRERDEAGLANVAAAVEQAAPGACNDGLIRGGLLGIVFVSDENDESVGYDVVPDYWQRYLDRIVAAHGDPSLVVASAVVGPTPAGCPGADPGHGYAEVVRATRGVLLSICDPWEEQLEVLAEAAVLRDTFVLQGDPIPETIEVWLNGIALPTSAWLWVRPSNAVMLVEPAAPGDRVEILYQESR